MWIFKANSETRRVDYSTRSVLLLTLASSIAIMFVLGAGHARGQAGTSQDSRGSCSPNIVTQGNVTVVCPGSASGGDRSPLGNPSSAGRLSEDTAIVPSCPVGMTLSRQDGKCVRSNPSNGPMADGTSVSSCPVGMTLSRQGERCVPCTEHFRVFNAQTGKWDPFCK